MKKIIAYIFLIGFLSACSAVFEKSIKDQSIDIYIPADSFKTKLYSQQFYWEKVTGATSYRLQIASPDFNSHSIQRMVLDTIMTANSITVLLSPGEYEWRLRAQNGGSETVYYTRKLFIDEADFDERPILIRTPVSTSVFSYDSSIAFEWYAVTGAQHYTVEMDLSTGNFSNPIITTVDYSQLIASAALTKRGKYKWRIYADSAGIKSLYSVTGYVDFRLDTANLKLPAHNAPGVSQNPTFEWDAPENGLSTDKYSYELYLYTSLNDADLVTDYPSAISPQAMPLQVGGVKSVQLMGLTKGKTYYWAIKAIDQYNNKSDLTAKRKFTVAL